MFELAERRIAVLDRTARGYFDAGREAFVALVGFSLSERGEVGVLEWEKRIIGFSYAQHQSVDQWNGERRSVSHVHGIGHGSASISGARNVSLEYAFRSPTEFETARRLIIEAMVARTISFPFVSQLEVIFDSRESLVYSPQAFGYSPLWTAESVPITPPEIALDFSVSGPRGHELIGMSVVDYEFVWEGRTGVANTIRRRMTDGYTRETYWRSEVIAMNLHPIAHRMPDSYYSNKPDIFRELDLRPKRLWDENGELQRHLCLALSRRDYESSDGELDKRYLVRALGGEEIHSRKSLSGEPSLDTRTWLERRSQ